MIMITVEELIAQLRTVDGSLKVLLQGDPEGNYYEVCRGVDDDCYWSHHEPNSVNSKEDLEEWGHPEAKQVVVLYP